MDLKHTLTQNIDDEWSKFLTNKYDDDDDNDNDDNVSAISDDFKDDESINTNKEWCDNDSMWGGSQSEMGESVNISYNANLTVPEPTDIYISTKSKIAYLTKPVNMSVFWNIPVISYSVPECGVIKKQIGIKSETPEELELVQERLKNETMCVRQHVMRHIDNPNGRKIKFKDIRKITIGVSTKDIMTCRAKEKQVFTNCFVMILRLKNETGFKEFHVKVFNTGKLEMPGVQNEDMFHLLIKNVISVLQPYYDEPLECLDKVDTILINSNFNCGFYINRDMLHDILKYKYNIKTAYDPCSYPGIQSTFYYNNDLCVQNGMQIAKENEEKYKNVTEVSFMIFRTGSVLISGMCEEHVIQEVYNFLTAILKQEFKFICQKLVTKAELLAKEKKKNVRRKKINIMTGVVEPTSECLNLDSSVINSVINSETVFTTSLDKRKPRKRETGYLEVVEEVETEVELEA